MTAHARQAGSRKSLGQHFLHDSRVVGRIIEAAELSPDDTVIEIGPGRGVLTRHLVRLAGRVVSVELDSALGQALAERLDFPANLTCVEADARLADYPSLAKPSLDYKVVGNLPYYAANPIVRRVLESAPGPRTAVVMVQKEVADSMVARPGDMGLLSVATQFYASARLVCNVPPRAFRPQPKVTSAVVRLDLRPVPAVVVSNVEEFFAVVRAGFTAPRKQLRNSLSQGLGVSAHAATAVLDTAGVEGWRRAETLGLEEWGSLYRACEQLRPAPEEAPREGANAG